MTSSSLIEEKTLSVFPLEDWSKRRVCLAVSGGADSVALLRVMTTIAERNNLKKNLFVVTVNHLSRGDESDGDVRFVQNLGQSLGLDVFVQTLDRDELQAEARRQGSWESAARTLRYRLLIEFAKRYGARFIATAHHQDDQLETLIFRLFRGSGLDGLHGIAPYRVVDDAILIVRPLLSVKKTEIVDYLDELRQDFRTDSSNASDAYTRNCIRHKLIPTLNEIFPNRWEKSLLRLNQLAEGIEDYFEEKVDELEARIETARRHDSALCKALIQLNVQEHSNANPIGDRVDLPIATIVTEPDEILCRLFRRIWKRKKWGLAEMGHDEWTRLVRTARNGVPTNQFPNNVYITFPQNGVLRIERKIENPTPKSNEK